MYLSQNISAFKKHVQNILAWLKEDNEDETLFVKINLDVTDSNSEASPEFHPNVFLFFAGLTNLNNDTIKEIMPLIPFNPDKNVDFSSPCHSIFECQCPHFISQNFQSGSWN